MSVIRRSVIFIVLVIHVIKYLVGRFKLVLLKTLFCTAAKNKDAFHKQVNPFHSTCFILKQRGEVPSCLTASISYHYVLLWSLTFKTINQFSTRLIRYICCLLNKIGQIIWLKKLFKIFGIGFGVRVPNLVESEQLFCIDNETNTLFKIE